MNWNDLKFVLAVHQARSFQGAGRLLGMTHTTVGRRISALEEQLRTPLFLRERKRCVPTPVCVRLVTAATRIEDEVARAQQDTGLDSAGATGAVRVISTHWIVNTVLVPAVPALRAQHPGVLLRLQGGLAEAGPGETDPTISLRFELEPRRAEEVIPVARIGYAVYAAAGAERTDSLPWVSFASSFPFDWLRAQGVPVQAVVVTANDASAVQLAIRHGIGRGLLPEVIGDRDPTLQRLTGPLPELTRVLRAVGLWQHMTDDPGRAVLSWVERQFREIGCAIDP